eukprot:gene34865-44697_t
MDALFHEAPETVRYGVGEVLYGIDEIRAFRKGRGGSPQRKLGRVEITTYGPGPECICATANAEFFREGSDRRGRQSQTWVKFADGWKVVAAHDFVQRFGFLFEHSPWVVAGAADKRPFADLNAMHTALVDVVANEQPDAQLALLRAHPKLADKAAIAEGLTKESAAEQASAGLDKLTPDEFARFHALNEAYDAKFDFPFIICVRLAGGKVGILKAMTERLNNSIEQERMTALNEVARIVWMRLND